MTARLNSRKARPSERSLRRTMIALAAGKDAADMARPMGTVTPGPTTFEISSRCFAAFVDGNCLMPYVPDGDVIIVDPDVGPAPGDFVLIVWTSGECAVKALVDCGPEYVRVAMFNPGKTLRARTADIARLFKVAGFLTPEGVERFGGRSPHVVMPTLSPPL